MVAKEALAIDNRGLANSYTKPKVVPFSTVYFSPVLRLMSTIWFVHSLISFPASVFKELLTSILK